MAAITILGHFTAIFNQFSLDKATFSLEKMVEKLQEPFLHDITFPMVSNLYYL